MMPILFTVGYFLGLLYMVTRRFDLFTLTYLTATVYFLPAFFGITHDGIVPLTKNEIALEQYLYYFYYFALLLAFSWLFTKLHSKLVNGSHQSDAAFMQGELKTLTAMSRVAGFLAPLLLLMAWGSMGQALFAADKKVVLENFSIFYALFETTVLIYFFTSFICKRRIHIVFSFILILFDLYIGFRAIGAFALILAFTFSLFLNPSGKNTLIFGATLIVGYTIASLYKIITVFFKYGETATGFLMLLDIDSVMDSLLITESFTTQEVFGKTIASKLALPLEYPLEIVRIFLPGVNNMLFGKGLGFNDYYQDKLFSHIPWGMGSNVWAEQYAIWGWSGPAALVVVLFSLLFYLNKKAFQWNESGRVHSLAITIFAVAPTYFYIHRNDLLFQLSVTRNFLMVWIVIYWLVKYVAPTFKKHLRQVA